MTRDAIAAIDIGGTKIALGLSDTEGREPAFRRFPTRLSDGPHGVVASALEELERMAREEGARVRAVGCGCGGPLDYERGMILSPPNLPGWDEFPVVRIIEERLGVPVALDNDANAAALGEHEYGAGRGLRDLVYITISTGIGGGLIVGGRLVRGVGGAAGEVGHMVVEPGGPLCPCGARGCLEALCSGTSIARRAAERIRAGGGASTLPGEGGRAEDVTARAVAEAVARGDALAREVWDETVEYLARGLVNVVATLAPEAVILGGGVSTAGELLLAPLRERVRELVKIVPVERVRIVQAALGADSAVYGALLLARSALQASQEQTASP